MASSGDFPSDGEDYLFSSSAPIPGNDIRIRDDFRMSFPRRAPVQYNKMYTSRLQSQRAKILRMEKLKPNGAPEKKIDDLLTNGHLIYQRLSRPNILFSSVMPSLKVTGGKVQVPEKAFHQAVLITGTALIDHGNADVLKEVAFGASTIAEKRKVTEGIWLEDETSKIRLVFEDDRKLSVGIVNGQVIGAVGNILRNGSYHVESIIWPEPIFTGIPKPTFNYTIVFVSGIQYGISTKKKVEALFSVLHAIADTVPLVVFFVGNSVNCKADPNSQKVEILKELDSLLAKLAKVARIILIPGLGDPASPMLPQQPLTRCLFPESYQEEYFHPVTNPSKVSLRTRYNRMMEVICCSGENLSDFMKASNITACMDAASLMLKGGHLCPTAPDSTRLYPLSTDIFVIKQAPTWLVFGNQENTAFQDFKGTTIITLASFTEKFEILVFANNKQGFIQVVK